jgi:hypothetical protein
MTDNEARADELRLAAEDFATDYPDCLLLSLVQGWLLERARRREAEGREDANG